MAKCTRISECELTHCINGHHIDEEQHGMCEECEHEELCCGCGGKYHPGLSCDEYQEQYADEIDLQERVREAELAAGWDPNP